jgi:phosphohistidine phosphatase
MELIVVRHELAAPASPELDDAARPLTARGRKRARKLARGLSALELRFDRLYHSPLLRALETAEALHPLVDGETRVSAELAAAPSRALLDELEGERAVLVGHEPWLSELIAWLVLGWQVIETDRSDGSFALEKGGVAWLHGEPEPGGMTLRALLPPRTLRALGR